MTVEGRRTIYTEDGSFYRYRDSNMWGRFQTAATIEGGVLYGLYGVSGPSDLEKALFVTLASSVILIICRFAWKDVVDCRAHLKRISEFENDIAPFPRPKWRGPLGAGLLLTAMWIINVANVGLIVKFFTKAWLSPVSSFSGIG